MTTRFCRHHSVIWAMMAVFFMLLWIFGISPVMAEDIVSDANAISAPAPSNPYGLAAMWNNGDVISRTVLLILLIMSLGTWYIMITKFMEQHRLFMIARTVDEEFWGYGNLVEGIAILPPTSAFTTIVRTAMSAVEHHEDGMNETIDLYSWTTLALQRALHTVQGSLQKGLAFLGTVGSTSPFIGLFGTVWGIYHALTAIGISGQASIDKVAGPVGESLIMTAIGLATAVPAVLGYNYLVRRNKVAMDKVRDFTADVQAVILGGIPAAYAAQEPLEGERTGGPTTVTVSQTIEH